jgi:hypothetical protein
LERAVSLPVSPEHWETRVVRLETRQEDIKRQLELTVPLVGAVAVQGLRLDEVKDDVTEGLRSVRSEVADIKAEFRGEIAELKRDEKAKAKERRSMLVALLLAGAGLLGTFASQLIQLRGGR